MALLPFLREVTKLPPEQRKVLVPLIAWQLSVEQPGFVLEGDLREAVTQFIAELRPNEEGMAERLEAKLASAGITRALLREAQVSANLSPLTGTRFEPREPPKTGQIASGPAAQFALRSRS